MKFPNKQIATTYYAEFGAKVTLFVVINGMVSSCVELNICFSHVCD